MADKRITADKRRKANKKKHRGRGFFLSLLILIIAGGVVFYFGWVQFQLEEGQYAVIHTKTGGYENDIIKSGEFSWRWEALLPTNLTVHAFTLETRRLNIEQDGTLPSGDFYGVIVGQDVNFNWKFSTTVTYRLKPETLPNWVKNGFSPNELDDIYNDFEQRLYAEITDTMVAAGKSWADEAMIPDYKALEVGLKEKAAEIDTQMEILTLTIKQMEFPDITLYTEARRLYLSLMSQREAVLAEVESTSAMREDIQSARLSLLERYGKVLSEYPVLLDLFALEGNPGVSLLPPENLQ